MSKSPDPVTTKSREETGLLPCPFCGHDGVELLKAESPINGALRWYPSCMNEECAFTNTDWTTFWTRREAITAWNARVLPLPSSSSPSVTSVEAEADPLGSETLRTQTEATSRDLRDTKRVIQRTPFGCARCCVAMLLDIPYDDVPDFVAEHGEWWARKLNDWLKPRGYALLITKGGATFVPDFLRVMAMFDATDDKPGHCVVVTKDKIIDPHEPPKELKDCTALYVFVAQPVSPEGQGQTASASPPQGEQSAPAPDIGMVIAEKGGEIGGMIYDSFILALPQDRETFAKQVSAIISSSLPIVEKEKSQILEEKP